MKSQTKFKNKKIYLKMKNNQNTIKATTILIAIFIMAISYSSCKKKTTPPPNPNEEELITTFQIVFIDSAGVEPNVTAIYRDIDGDGGNAPSTWDSIRLKANTTYLANILLLDETKADIDTISNEVLEEGVDHLFCFTQNGVNITTVATDTDLNGLPIGLQSKWKTGNMSTGSSQIVLRHQPDIKTGSCTPGESDIDLTFQCFVN